MKVQHEVNVSYDKAWKGHVIALNSTRGTSEASYATLSAFLNAHIQSNSDT